MIQKILTITLIKLKFRSTFQTVKKKANTIEVSV